MPCALPVRPLLPGFRIWRQAMVGWWRQADASSCLSSLARLWPWSISPAGGCARVILSCCFMIPPFRSRACPRDSRCVMRRFLMHLSRRRFTSPFPTCSGSLSMPDLSLIHHPVNSSCLMHGGASCNGLLASMPMCAVTSCLGMPCGRSLWLLMSSWRDLRPAWQPAVGEAARRCW